MNGKRIVTFKTPVDYFQQVLDGKYQNINRFKKLLETKNDWDGYDCDLHIYPYIHARPALLSVGCPNQCPFCPTAITHKGRIHFGNYKYILSQYKNENIHFMDENLFYNNSMDRILILLKKQKIQWLAMSDYKSTIKILEKFGEDYLYDCGLRIIEIGLENVALFKKVKDYIPTKKIVIYYLNMTCLPGETKESIAENARWMKPVSLKRSIHFNNGVWYACGQFFYPYDGYQGIGKGKWVNGKIARTRPSWIPNSLLSQEYNIISLERTNYYSQLIYGIKIYKPKSQGIIGDFIQGNQRLATWMLSGIRCGGII